MPLNNPPLSIGPVLRRATANGHVVESNPLFTAAGRCWNCQSYSDDLTCAFAPPIALVPPYQTAWSRVGGFHWKWEIIGQIQLGAKQVGDSAAGLIQIDFELDEPTVLTLHVELRRVANFTLTGPSNERIVTTVSDQIWNNLTYAAGSYRISLSDSLAGPADPHDDLTQFMIFPENIVCDCEQEDEP